jgi:hypothetical protein
MDIRGFSQHAFLPGAVQSTAQTASPFAGKVRPEEPLNVGRANMLCRGNLPPQSYRSIEVVSPGSPRATQIQGGH